MSFPVAAGNPSMSGAYIPEIWSGKLLEKFYTSTVFGDIANTDYEGEIKNQGDEVMIRVVPDMVIRDYEMGQALVEDKPETKKVSLKVDKGKYYNTPINDVEKLQSDIAYVEKWSDDAGQQMKKAIDRSILAAIYTKADAHNSGATAGKIYASVNLGVAGTPLALSKDNVVDFIVDCGQVLDEQDIPDTDRYLVLPVWLTSRIKKSDLKDASMTGDGQSVLRNGRIGVVDRFTIYSSNQLPVVTDGSYKACHALAGHKSALTFASQLVENELIPNPKDFGKLMRGLQVYGFEVLQPTALIDAYIRPA